MTKELSTELRIDMGLQATLRDLSGDEMSALEQNIVSAGRAIDPIITWQGLIVDGHHRYSVCTEHNLPYTTLPLPEDWTREDVKDWIIDHQSGRRNLAPQEVSYYRGKMFNTNKSYGEGLAERLASEGGVSVRTVRNDGKYAEAMDKLDTEVRDAILSGDAAASRDDVENLSQAPPEKQKKAVKQRNVRKVLAPLADLASPYRRAVLDLQRIKRFVDETCLDAKVGRYLATKQTRIERCLQEAIDCLSQCEPTETCEDCGGKGCNSCYGTGFLNRAAVQSREN